MSNQDDKNLLDDKNAVDNKSTVSNSASNGGSKPPKQPPKVPVNGGSTPPKKPEQTTVGTQTPPKVEAVQNGGSTPSKAPSKPSVPPKAPKEKPSVPPKKVDAEVKAEGNAKVSETPKAEVKVENKADAVNIQSNPDKPTPPDKPSVPPKAPKEKPTVPPKKTEGAKPLDNKAKVPHVSGHRDKDETKVGKQSSDKDRPLKSEEVKPLKSESGEKLKDDKNDKPQDELKKSISRDELKAAKREEKERLKRERQRVKEEQKNRKDLNDDSKKEFGAGQALKGAGNSKNAKTGDMNQKKKGKKKWLLLLLLLLLIFILIFFLIWGDDILNPEGEYHIDPTGNIVEIKPNVEGWALEDCRFMAGDTIYFVENLYLLLPRVNEDGKYNNMCSFRFRVLLETDEEVFSDCIDYINEKGSTTIKYYRGYWYYYGIILPDNQIREIITSITFKRSLGNNIAGKLCTLRFELETVYPSGEEIDNTFGACPGDWRFGIEEYYLELLNEGWR